MPVLPADILFILDHEQQNAIALTDSDKHVWIHGQNEGKRIQLLIHSIVEHLFSGKTCLIQVPKDVEDVVCNVLAQLGLSEAVMNLNGLPDPAVIGAMKLARKKQVRDDARDLAILGIEKYNGWLHAIEGRHRKMDKQVFGDLTWKAVLDKSLTNAADSYRSVLDASLSSHEFDLSQQEYWHLKGRIKTFQRLRVLRTPAFEILDSIADTAFVIPDGQKVKLEIAHKLNEAITRGKDLLKVIGNVIHQYRRDITGSRHTILQSLRNRILDLEEMIETGVRKHGNDLLIESTFNELAGRLKRTMLRRSQELEVLRNEIRRTYDHLITAYAEAYASQEHTQPDFPSNAPLEEMPELLQGMLTRIDTWSAQIEAAATTQKRRLNARNIVDGHALGSSLQEVEAEIASYVRWMNTQAILREAIEVNALSLEKSSEVIKSVVLHCMRLRNAMAEFEAYYLWRTFWSKLSSGVKVLMESLDLMEDHEQFEAFDAWYLNNVLDQIPEADMLRSIPDNNEFGNRINDLRAVVVEHISARLQNERFELLRDLKGKNKRLLQCINNGNQIVLAEELKVVPAQVLARMFPIVFCSSVHLRDYAYYFDSLMVFNRNGADFKAACAQSQRCVFLSPHAPALDEKQAQELQSTYLRTPSTDNPLRINELPASDRLKTCRQLASILSRFGGELNGYNARNIQVLSFMGATIDKQVLEQLQVPYKMIGTDGTISTEQLTEALLDTRKPMVLLTRDGILGYTYKGAMFWQSSLCQFVNTCGVPVINTWSANWKSDAKGQFEQIMHMIKGLISPVEMTDTSQSERIQTGDLEVRTGTA